MPEESQDENKVRGMFEWVWQAYLFVMTTHTDFFKFERCMWIMHWCWMGAGRTSRQQGKKKNENYFNDSILGASRWSKCETGFKYLYSRHFTGRVNTRSMAETVSQWRCITALKRIKWLGTKETSEAWNYWRDKKKTLMNYCNWLLSYYKLVFLKYISCGVLQWWFKGFAVNKKARRCRRRCSHRHVNKLSTQVCIDKDQHRIIC